jgi:urease alpha subunit
MNNFAAQSDQSLNITKEQVDALPVHQVIIAHEHQKREVGKVLIPGNQIATSISDWQGCTHKYKAVVTENSVELVQVKERSEEYIEHLWTDPQVTDHKFVRLVGSATAEQAPDVVNAVARFRAASPALVVGNGVQIATADGLGDFAASLESVQAFDVWSALSDVLEATEIETLKGLE